MAPYSHPIQSLGIDERVERVLLNMPLIDGHNDLPQQPRAITEGKIYHNPKFDLEKGFERGMTDIPRLARVSPLPSPLTFTDSAVDGQFWSICVPCLRSAENFSTPEYSDMARDAIEQIDLTLRLVESYPDVFQLAHGPGDVKRIYKEGKTACSIGIEGIGIIRALYRLGVRYCTMTQVCNNAFADSSTSKIGPVHGGLSRLGRSAVLEMNRLGMIIDCSHVSEACAHQVLDLTRAPIMFSHSNAKSVFDCPRNLPDDIIDRVPANGGMIMVTFVPEHVHPPRRSNHGHAPRPSLLHREPHRMGELEDVKCYPGLLEAILDRGATEDQLALVAGENVLRVWAGVEKVRNEMKHEGLLPIEDDKLGLGWYGVPLPEEGLYLED
ncbi:hypothetical protein BDW72DRAFT_201863 [Aspergillus terricola var. indicus]